MAMYTVTIINNTAGTVDIEDIGISIDASASIDFHDLFTYGENAFSDDLRAAVLAGTLTVNDGTSDLSNVDGEDWLVVVNKQWLEDNYWNKTELADTGGSNDRVDWSQIQNAPDFTAIGSWKEPVDARVLDITSTPPAGAVEGDFYIDTDDNELYRYDGASWNVDSTAGTSVGIRVIDLDSTGEHIFEFDSTAWVDAGINQDNDAVIVNDDGDGKPSMYIFDEETGTGVWIKIADADILTTGNTLDDAYDQNGAGAGRTVTVDTGPVEFDASASTDPPLELTDLASAPTTNLDDGCLAVINGILYAYDATRTKWLSVHRETFVFGRRGRTRNQWLNFSAGNLASNNSGYRMSQNATIVSIAGQLDASGTTNMRVRRNDVATNIATLTITATDGNTDNAVDVDLTAGDYLQGYNNSSAGVQDPMMVVEIAWRA